MGKLGESGAGVVLPGFGGIPYYRSVHTYCEDAWTIPRGLERMATAKKASERQAEAKRLAILDETKDPFGAVDRWWEILPPSQNSRGCWYSRIGRIRAYLGVPLHSLGEAARSNHTTALRWCISAYRPKSPVKREAVAAVLREAAMRRGLSTRGMDGDSIFDPRDGA